MTAAALDQAPADYAVGLAVLDECAAREGRPDASTLALAAMLPGFVATLGHRVRPELRDDLDPAQAVRLWLTVRSFRLRAGA